MFQIVPKENYPALETFLESNRLPKSAMMHNVLCLLQSGRLPPSVSTTIYAFNGIFENLASSNETDNVFIIAIQFRKITGDYAVVLSVPMNPSSEMIESLEELIDWKFQICFCAIDNRFSPVIANLCKKNATLLATDACDFMTMTNAHAKSLQPIASDPSVEINELFPSDAELVTKRWLFSDPATQGLMEEMIRETGSAGVYVNKKLVSMVVIFAMGSINALYTEDDFRGKGYGKLTMQKVCQVAGHLGLVPNVQIVLGNTPSKRLMESIGFTDSHVIEWVTCKPAV